ncbi:AEC family transporter [Variovorax rhizosphaerae]|uniref:AEC family transporter n=1 Tax=Variovorax rhizosphaerae TaxID=1836200 RepID=A0ABU8WX17_9BURK
MIDVFLVTFPFFALIAAGYAAGRRGVLPLQAIPGLNIFVLYFALPCMLYRFGAGTPIGQLLDASVALVWGFCSLLTVCAVVLASRRRIGWNDASFGALVAAFPNTGFMGMPLLGAILGASSAGPVIITLIFDMVVTSSLCIALSRLDAGNDRAANESPQTRPRVDEDLHTRRSRVLAAPQGRSPAAGRPGVARALRHALRGILLNPMPWSILLGGLASAMSWRLPGPLDRTVAMLADAASPVALFTIGTVLARSALLARGRRRADAVHEVLPVVLAKLFVHPLLMFGVARLAMAAGLPLSHSAMVALVLLAALPSASNVSMLAERFGADNGRIARIILWTTVAAFFTYPLAVGWLHPATAAQR